MFLKMREESKGVKKNWCKIFTKFELTSTKLVFLDHTHEYLGTRNRTTIWPLICITEDYRREDLLCGTGERSFLVIIQACWELVEEVPFAFAHHIKEKKISIYLFIHPSCRAEALWMLVSNALGEWPKTHLCKDEVKLFVADDLTVGVPPVLHVKISIYKYYFFLMLIILTIVWEGERCVLKLTVTLALAKS